MEAKKLPESRESEVFSEKITNNPEYLFEFWTYFAVKLKRFCGLSLSSHESFFEKSTQEAAELMNIRYIFREICERREFVEKN